jgi:hypothetical protein
MKKRYFCQDQKYEGELPKSVTRALDIDKEIGMTFWRDALKKEMKNIMMAFKILNNNDLIPPGYQQIPGNIVLDIKADFTQKARFVAGGHVLTLLHLLHMPVLSQGTACALRSPLLISNGLNIKGANAQNESINSPTQAKYWIQCGTELGHHQGKQALIVRALYGLKGSALA